MFKSLSIKAAILATLTILIVNLSYAQNDWEKQLKEDLVIIDNGMYHVNDFALITINEQTFQIKMSAEAPTTVMSRDFFLSSYSTLGTMTLLTIFAEAGYSISDVDIKEIDDVIGQPDITLNFVMAKNGMQIQIITDQGTERLTMSWDEFFGS